MVGENKELLDQLESDEEIEREDIDKCFTVTKECDGCWSIDFGFMKQILSKESSKMDAYIVARGVVRKFCPNM